MGRLVDLQTTQVRFSFTAPSVPGTVKITELTAVGVKDVTCQLTKNSKLPSYGGDKTTEEGAICESVPATIVTGATVDGEFMIFRDFTTGAPTTLVDPSTYLTGPGQPVWVYVRDGLKFDVAPLAGQIWDVYPGSFGAFQKMRGSGDGYHKGKVTFYPAGDPKENVISVA